MKILLIQDVDELGSAGDVKEVATGYGRNYLIPHGLAVLATDGALKDAHLHRRRAEERRQREADEMAALAHAISQTTLVFQAKAGDKGRLYGSITSADVAERLTDAIEKEIDRRRITLGGPIKELGTHTVTVRLGAEVTAQVNVVVEPIEPVEALDTAEALAQE